MSAKKTVTSRFNKLHFWGQHERPMTIEQVVRANSVSGTGKYPAELRELGEQQSIYVIGARGTNSPTANVKALGDHGDSSIWQVRINSGATYKIGQLPGRTLLRAAPEQIASEINPKVDFTSYRPEWLNHSYQPRVLPRTVTSMLKRFNGRRVNPAYIFGPDDRHPYMETSWPWGLVGKVFNSDGKVGSAALAWGNFIVTAGHVVPWDTPNNWSMTFVPDFFNGQSLFGAGVQSNVSDVLGYNTSYFSGSPTGYDWAICKLFDRLGDSLGFFGFNGYTSDWNELGLWIVLGYPLAINNGNVPSFQNGISIHDNDGDNNGGEELESETADISAGNSGGPIFAFWNGDPRIIGVVSGEEEEHRDFSDEDNNIFASGDGLGNLIAWGRSNW